MASSSSPNYFRIPGKARTAMFEAVSGRGPQGEPRLLGMDSDQEPFYAMSRCILAETLIKDIPNTVHHIFIYNDVDAPEWNDLPPIRRPMWSSGTQNAFFPHNSTASYAWNHHHAVIGMGAPLRHQRGHTGVEIRMGSGGPIGEWHPEGLYHYKGMQLFADLKSYLRVPFGSATCIKLSFEIDSENDNGMMMMISGVENVVPERPISPLDWHDSVRVDIAQEGHPHIISLNMRFVESQHPDPDAPHMTRVAIFSIKGTLEKLFWNLSDGSVTYIQGGQTGYRLVDYGQVNTRRYASPTSEITYTRDSVPPGNAPVVNDGESMDEDTFYIEGPSPYGTYYAAANPRTEPSRPRPIPHNKGSSHHRAARRNRGGAHSLNDLPRSIPHSEHGFTRGSYSGNFSQPGRYATSYQNRRAYSASHGGRSLRQTYPSDHYDKAGNYVGPPAVDSFSSDLVSFPRLPESDTSSAEHDPENQRIQRQISMSETSSKRSFSEQIVDGVRNLLSSESKEEETPPQPPRTGAYLVIIVRGAGKGVVTDLDRQVQ
ncbi:hypothetical protein F53441_1115 [Fusarium austroafricanum]|uniref:Uncharacterized protein n=1 Tax=Fusarium austroafricanum TaxID=2364996 RepID=A0A8H4KW50_9HYPO|nr:hypothetical protein F53441_1115 [Fusarium austroafricanum]